MGWPYNRYKKKKKAMNDRGFLNRGLGYVEDYQDVLRDYIQHCKLDIMVLHDI